jgi:hypothetical protein
MSITLTGPDNDKLVRLDKLTPMVSSFMEPTTGCVFIRVQRAQGTPSTYLCLRLGQTLGISRLAIDLKVLPVNIDSVWSYPNDDTSASECDGG